MQHLQEMTASERELTGIEPWDFIALWLGMVFMSPMNTVLVRFVNIQLYCVWISRLRPLGPSVARVCEACLTLCHVHIAVGYQYFKAGW